MNHELKKATVVLNDLVFPGSSGSREEGTPAEAFPKAEGVRAVSAAELLVRAGLLGAGEKCVLFARVAPVVRGTTGSEMIRVCPAEGGQSCPQHWGAVLEHSHTETLGIFKEAKACRTFKVQGIEQLSDEHPVRIFLFGYDCTLLAKCCVLKYMQIQDSKSDLSDIPAYQDN